MHSIIKSKIKFDNSVILIFLGLVFPFFLDFTIFEIEIMLKDIYLVCISYHLFINFKNRNMNKLIKLIILIYLLSLFFFTYKIYVINENNEIKLFKLFLSNYVHSLVSVLSSLIIFFWLKKELNKQRYQIIYKWFNYLSIIIILEFSFYLLIKYLNISNIFVIYFDIGRIYSFEVFRSLLLGDHILTVIFIGLNFFLSIYSLSRKIEYIVILRLLLYLTIIFYNIETKLTILSFLFSLIIFLFYLCKKHKINFLIKYNLLFLFILIMAVIFSTFVENEKTNYLDFIYFKLSINSLIDRFNINLITLYNILQNPFGVGWNLAGNNFFLNTIKPAFCIAMYNEDLFSSCLLFSSIYFIEFHGDFIQPHGYMLNVIASFGIFTYPISKILMNELNNYNILESSKQFLTLNIIILFVSTSLLLNFVNNIEIILAIIFSLYFKMRFNDK